ncbi:MAG: histidine phosphatase family protein [Candidatus Hydrogenedentes bacterium]|nr:histidine phosphatase family protein [Candidatus Hydrogenedentota bacterium]
MGFLTVVRHGQASFHEDEYDRLSSLGEEQARCLGAYWARHGIRFDRVVSGPLIRQRRSAEIAGEVYASEGFHWPGVEVVDELAELPGEALAAKFMPQLCMEDPFVLEAMQRFGESDDRAERERLFQKAFEKLLLKWAREEYAHTDIESFAAFIQRVRDSYERVTLSGENGQRVAVFTSGGPTAVAMYMALGTSLETTLELAWQVRNGSFTEFQFTKDRFSLNTFNATPHLSEPRLWTYR